MESVAPPCECVTYYIAEAQRFIDVADAESLIECFSALTVLLPKVTELHYTFCYFHGQFIFFKVQSLPYNWVSLKPVATLGDEFSPSLVVTSDSLVSSPGKFRCLKVFLECSSSHLPWFRLPPSDSQFMAVLVGRCRIWPVNFSLLVLTMSDICFCFDLLTPSPLVTWSCQEV